MTWNRFPLFCRLVAGCCLAFGLFAAAILPAGEMRPNVAAVCNRVKPAFVFIGGGSGVIVSPDGWMLTNNHVVGDVKQFDVRTGDRKHYRANLLGRDVTGDLAALQLELNPHEKTPYLEPADPETLHLGDFACAVGNPFAEGLVDQNPTFTLGVISGLNQTTPAYADVVVTDAALNPGNSGGPLVNMAGQLIGVNGQIATRWGLRSGTGLGYAISSRQIRLWLPRLVKAKGGDVPHGRLSGVEFELSEEALWKAARIKSVVRGTSSDQCGLKAGDRVLQFDGRAIDNTIQLAQTLRMYPQDYEVTVRVEREGKPQNLRMKLSGVRPGSLGITLAQPGKNDPFVRIGGLAKDSPGQQAGLKPGDEILGVEGVEFKMPAQAQFRLLHIWFAKGVFAGEPVRIKVRRKGSDGKATPQEFQVLPR
jgi:S1-C subfamily serine protease